MQKQITILLLRMPWWLLLLLGLACVAVGLFLTLRPFRSLTVLSWLITAGLLLIGISQVVAAGASTHSRLALLRGVGGGGGGRPGRPLPRFDNPCPNHHCGYRSCSRWCD